MTISETITVWTLASVLIFILWGLMMGDPGGSNTQDAIITIVCAILALPVTIVILLIIGIIELILMIIRIRKKSKIENYEFVRFVMISELYKVISKTLFLYLWKIKNKL